MDRREEENNLGFGKSLWNLKKKQPSLLHPGMAQLSRGKPKFNFLSESRTINESSTLHFCDQLKTA